MRTLEAVITRLAGRFTDAGLFYGHGTDSAWDEAVALVLGVTQLPDDRGSAAMPIDGPALARIEQLALRRIAERLPLPYLLGRMTYAGHEFLIEPGIVIPRSPIAQLIRNGLRPWLAEPPTTIVDVCTGSGCLGILCAKYFPSAEVTLIDLDPVAIDLAQRNVALHELESRVRVVQSDLFATLPKARWDLIVANPPYVDAADLATMPPEYRHEPRLGLAGGPDGLDTAARLVDTVVAHLGPNGLFVGEVGASSPALLRRYPNLPFIWPDLPDGGEGVFLLEATAFGSE